MKKTEIKSTNNDIINSIIKFSFEEPLNPTIINFKKITLSNDGSNGK